MTKMLARPIIIELGRLELVHRLEQLVESSYGMVRLTFEIINAKHHLVISTTHDAVRLESLPPDICVITHMTI